MASQYSPEKSIGASVRRAEEVDHTLASLNGSENNVASEYSPKKSTGVTPQKKRQFHFVGDAGFAEKH